MGLHALLIIPGERRQGIDFDAVFAEYLKPALEGAGLEVFRADDEQRAGDAELFSQLLRADLVLVDQTVPNPNVWYQFDVLRAFRARAVLRLHAEVDELNAACGRSPEALAYRLKDGRPDPAHLDAEREALTRRARSALGSAVPRAEREPGAPARRVLLFSGHMIDAPGRREARFPASKEELAAEAIGALLDQLGSDGDDLAICGGACGGDLLFGEAALRRGARLALHLQYREADFLKASVAFAGQSWIDRYYAVKANARTRVFLQPDELGPPPPGIDPYVRNNLWQLYTALAHGVDKLRFIALWNGEGGSGPGGTQNMVQTVRRYAGQVSIVDTRQLFGL